MKYKLNDNKVLCKSKKIITLSRHNVQMKQKITKPKFRQYFPEITIKIDISSVKQINFEKFRKFCLRCLGKLVIRILYCNLNKMKFLKRLELNFAQSQEV